MRTHLGFLPLLALALLTSFASAKDVKKQAPPPASVPAGVSVRVSIPEQKMYVFDGAKHTATYRVSTSAYGIGDSRGSYATPLGHLAVAAKIGQGAPSGSVFKGRSRTGEIVKVNARGRDPIVTRILHLRGCEKGNCRAYDRRIYIHGTPDERHIGRPASYGCVRMKSRDVIELFDTVSVGTPVEITDQRITSGLRLFTRSASAKPSVAAKVK